MTKYTQVVTLWLLVLQTCATLPMISRPNKFIDQDNTAQNYRESTRRPTTMNSRPQVMSGNLDDFRFASSEKPSIAAQTRLYASRQRVSAAGTNEDSSLSSPLNLIDGMLQLTRAIPRIPSSSLFVNTPSDPPALHKLRQLAFSVSTMLGHSELAETQGRSRERRLEALRARARQVYRSEMSELDFAVMIRAMERFLEIIQDGKIGEVLWPSLLEGSIRDAIRSIRSDGALTKKDI